MMDAKAAGALPARLATWPEDWRFAYEERAGIVEHLGGIPRDQAERDAERMARAEHARSRAAPGAAR